MTIVNASLPENVFPYPSMPPGKEDADDQGYVLWYHPTYGWIQGMWKWPGYTGATHWTYMPHRPPAQETPDERRDRLFNEWLSTFEHTFDPAASALLKMGWNGAFKKLQQNP